MAPGLVDGAALGAALGEADGGALGAGDALGACWSGGSGKPGVGKALVCAKTGAAKNNAAVKIGPRFIIASQ
ncbi:MAG TPA: hypothetical protein VKV77_04250 [Methylovirgula sp.]|nr:hypothetical protein [Methylovirgula sp.]